MSDVILGYVDGAGRAGGGCACAAARFSIRLSPDNAIRRQR